MLYFNTNVGATLAGATIPPDRKAVAPYSVTIFPLSLGSSPVFFDTLVQDPVQSPEALRALHIFRFDITHAGPPYIFPKVSPIKSLLQYRFATSNPLKARPGLAGCRIAPLRNLFPLGIPFSGLVLVWLILFTGVVAPTTCSSTTCLNYLSVVVKARRFWGRIVVKARNGVVVKARGKFPGITAACGNFAGDCGS